MTIKLLKKKPLIVLDSHNVDFMAAKSKLGKLSLSLLRH